MMKRSVYKYIAILCVQTTELQNIKQKLIEKNEIDKLTSKIGTPLSQQ